ncbi:MAG TPA: 2OG-Fe dioxygenase family protein [Nevskiaceae bacterium]
METSLSLPGMPCVAALRRDGQVYVPAPAMRRWLEAVGSLADWPAFAASWERMPEDLYMADGGHYRRRRHAVYRLHADGRAERQPHQPHYQSRDYNPLNGGVQRWFEPIEESVGASASLAAVFHLCALGFGSLQPAVPRWRCEVHQFRIEAGLHAQGQPTPEGMHHDGVDYVLVLLVHRHNVDSGTTRIEAPDGRDLGSFTLSEPCDATLVDDARVLHGVTPIQRHDPALPAYRDVLVVTLQRERQV